MMTQNRTVDKIQEMQNSSKITVCQAVFVCYMVVLQASVVAEALETCTNETSTDCCLCQQKSCDSECPTHLNELVTSSKLYTCNFGHTTSSSQTTQSSLTTTEMETVRDTTVDHSSSGKTTMTMTVCVMTCPDGYFSVENNCTHCNPICRTCNSSRCIECKFKYDGKCMEMCPENTSLVNDTVCVDKKMTEIKENDNSILPIIIGASSSGGAVVVIFIVIVICCCCRRKRAAGITGTQGKNGTRRTVMSGILEEKKNAGRNAKGKKGDSGSGRSRPDYENTAPKDRNLSDTIPNQGDVVMRYTKDPTKSVELNTKKPEASVNRDSAYANASAIRMLKNMGSETLKREIEEIEALPEAPSVPKDGRKKAKQTRSKVSISKRISQKISKLHKKKEGSKHPGEVYIDMSNASPVMGGKKTLQNQPDELEDYENTLEKRTKKPSESGKTFVESVPHMEDKLEDYENAPDKVKAESKPVNASMKFKALPKIESKPVLKTGDKNVQGDELQDYEKMVEKKLPLVPKVAAKLSENVADEDKLEDYENVQEIPSVQKGKTKELLKRFETGKKPTKSLQKNISDDLEDYENSAPLSKKDKISSTPTKNEGNSVEKKVTESSAEEEDYENTKELSKLKKSGQKSAKFEQKTEQKTVETDKPYENLEFYKKLRKLKKP